MEEEHCSDWFVESSEMSVWMKRLWEVGYVVYGWFRWFCVAIIVICC